MKKKIYTKFIAVLVTEETYQLVKMATDKLEISMTKFIRDILERELKSMQGNGNDLEVKENA
jgi:hypothetical protein